MANYSSVIPGQATLDRPPSLPPEVQPDMMSRLAGSRETQTADTGTVGIVASKGMALEQGLLELAQFSPGSEDLVAQAQQIIRQIVLAAMQNPTAGQSMAPPGAAPPEGYGMASLVGPTQGPPLG